MVVVMDVLDEIRLTTAALREREGLLDKRAALAWKAREAGHSWDEIALAMGVGSRQAAMNAGQRAKRRGLVSATDSKDLRGGVVGDDEMKAPCRACGGPVRLRRVPVRERSLDVPDGRREYTLERVCLDRGCPSNDRESLGRPQC